MSLYLSKLILPPDDKQDLVLFIRYDGTVFDPWGNRIDTKAIEVPPHGDLFDRDLLEVVSYHNREGTEDDTFDAGVRWLLEHIDGLLPVIPADPAEEEPT